jgi:hydrogenase maturation protease
LKSVALIGMGNIMFHDEGLGIYMVDYIQKNYEIPTNLTIIDGGTLGFKLMTYYLEYDAIIIVGTTSQRGEVGAVFINNADEVMAQGATRQSANEVEITMMLEICALSDAMGEMHMVSMVPEDIQSVRNGLSGNIEENMQQLEQATLELLKQYDIKLTPKLQTTPLTHIIHDYANPTTRAF